MGSPFLDLVTFVKVDLRAIAPSELAPIARKLIHRGIRLIAEKVETRTEHELSLGSGYEFFQDISSASRPSFILAIFRRCNRASSDSFGRHSTRNSTFLRWRQSSAPMSRSAIACCAISTPPHSASIRFAPSCTR